MKIVVIELYCISDKTVAFPRLEMGSVIHLKVNFNEITTLKSGYNIISNKIIFYNYSYMYVPEKIPLLLW